MIFAFFLRFLGQPQIPYGFHRDEAGIAYSAYSILKTGRDEWGRVLPLHFKALGDYPPGIYNYLTAISMFLIGYGELAERLPAIVFGSLLVPLVYQLTKILFKKENLGLIASFLVCISPWEIVQSRSGSEPIVALAFSLGGLLSYYCWLKHKQKKYLLIMGLLYFFALYTYNAVRLVLPLLHGLLSWYWQPKKFFQLNRLGLTIALLVFSTTLVFYSTQSGMRVKSVSIFNCTLVSINKPNSAANIAASSSNSSETNKSLRFSKLFLSARTL